MIFLTPFLAAFCSFGNPLLRLVQDLSKSKPGYLSPPLRLGEWYVLLRLEQWIPAQLDDPTRQKLLDSLFESWLQDQLTQPQPLLPTPASPRPA